MREILFRGKRIDNQEWEEGYYVCLNGNEHRIYDGFAETDCGDFYPDWWKVDPATVGQFTGLTDKNGKRIFEGDILQIVGYGGIIDRCVVGFGIYEAFGKNRTNVGFFLYWKNDKEQYQKYANLAWWVEEREAVCVGNIHDNPELIGGASDENA